MGFLFNVENLFGFSDFMFIKYLEQSNEEWDHFNNFKAT